MGMKGVSGMSSSKILRLVAFANLLIRVNSKSRWHHRAEIWRIKYVGYYTHSWVQT
jgi:hypothetical protein